jgi:hypothetical protein
MKKRLCGAGAALGLVLAVTGSPAQASADSPPERPALPLGPSDLLESRTTRTLQPGVTLTRIVRGDKDPAHHWTVEASIPGGGERPVGDALLVLPPGP